MDTTLKRRDRKDRYWEEDKSTKDKGQNKKKPSKKRGKKKSKVKLVTPSGGKSGKK